MTEPAGRRDGDRTDELAVDPDIDLLEGTRDRASGSPFEHQPPSPWPPLHADVLGAVFLGGCVGGYARYAVSAAWDIPRDALPVATLTVNLTGAFVLGIVVVVATDIRPNRYLRPLLGTGFCGALTTFAAVVVAIAQLLAQHRFALAGGYLGATIVGGLAAASLGLILGRAVRAQRRRVHDERST
jgi:CrcB protein